LRKSQTYRLFVPQEIKAIIDSEVKRNRYNYYFLVHHIFVKTLINKHQDKGFVAINCKLFNQITTYNATTYISLLNKCEIIVSDELYKKGQKKLHYKINPTLNITPAFVELPSDTIIYKNLKKDAYKKRAHVNILPSQLKTMYKLFNSLEFDYDAALKWIADNKELGIKKVIAYTFSLEMFRNKDFRYFKRNKTNKRLDTNITNIPKVLRQFIVTPNLVSIDLKNSQPFMLFLILNHIIKHNNKPSNALCIHIKNSNLLKFFGAWAIKDILKLHKFDEKQFSVELSKFNDWTQSGQFYDNFISNYESEITRAEVKQSMIRVLFSNNHIVNNFKSFIPYKKEKATFAKVFPHIYDIIFKLKTKNNKNLANTLTKIESYLFIDIICKKLHDNNITPLTIHDSIIVPESVAEQTLKIMQEAFFEQTGFNPTFDVEKIN
jgi:hypothetical protein